MADIRLQAVDGQDDAALRAEQRLQPPGIGRGQGPQLIVAVQEVGDGALGEDDPPAGEFAVDLGDTAVLGIAEPADQGHDVESELVIGQGEVELGLGAVAGPPRHFFLSFLGFSIVTNYRTYTLYLLSTTKATTNLVKRCEDVPQRFSFPPNAELAIRPSPPILMRWPWGR